MKVDESTELFLRQIRAAPVGDDRDAVADFRAADDAGGPSRHVRTDVSAVQDVVVSPPDSADVQLRIYHPETDEPCPVVVWAHGGYWVRGDLDTHDTFLRALTASAGCILVAVDQRRAPEHRFPAALNDVYGAVRWAVAEAASIGGLPGKVAVGGDGSGANLAAAAALVARMHGEVELAHQILLVPVLDAQLASPSWDELDGRFNVRREDLRWALEQYAPGVDRSDPLLSPLRAKAHADLPSALILTAELDPLRDDGRRYGQRLRDAGTQVELVEYMGLIHDAFLAAGAIERGRIAVEDAGRRIRAALVSTG